MKRILVILLLFVGITYASAQEVYTSSGKPNSHKKAKKKKGYDPDKLIVGGGVMFAYDGGYANMGLSPIIGYRILDKLSAGVGLGYVYAQRPVPDLVNQSKTYFQKAHIVYPSLWARYFVFRNFYVSTTVEYDYIHTRRQGFDNTGNSITVKSNLDNTCLFMGVGSRFPLGGRISFFGEMVYDVLQGQNSPYSTGIPTLLRIGIAAGL